MKNQKGFSLVELLVVVIIIAIIAAIAIPSLLASRRAANEASAISSLRTVHSAQATYQATLGNNSAYATTLAILSAAGTDLIDDTLGGGSKSGYDFALTTNTADTPPNTLYCAAGDATDQGSSGVRSFGVDNTGVIKAFAGAGATAGCADGVLTGGAAIQ